MKWIVYATAALVVFIGYAFVSQLRQARREAIAKLARLFKELRTASGREPRREPVSRDHPRLKEQEQAYDDAMRELESHGLRYLGDYEEFRPDGNPAGITRWFVDADGTTSGWFAIIDVEGAPRRVAMLFCEGTPPQYVATTWGGANNTVAAPATIVRLLFAPTDSLEAVLRGHRDALARLAPAIPQPVTTIAEAVALVSRLRVHTHAWRSAQSEASLLELDLRSVLQDKYNEVGPDMRRALQESTG